MEIRDKISFDIGCVAEELDAAVEKFPPMRSPHEGYAIILEEMDELWEEIKKQHDAWSKDRMYDEAKQVAAMAIRFMVDCV